MAASRFTLPDADSGSLCRALGLAISNISMYGLAHSVSATSLSQAFDELVSKADLYGPIEFVFTDGALMVNGGVVETARSTGQLLVSQLVKLDVHDFEFLPPVSRSDFSKFMELLSSSPGQGQIADGFEAAVAAAKIKSVQIEGISYARVDKNAAEAAASADPKPSAAGKKSFDLDSELGLEELGGSGFESADSASVGVTSAAAAYLEQKRSVANRKAQLIELVRSKGASPQERKVLRQQLFDAGLEKEDWDELLLASGVVASRELPENSAHAVESLQRLLTDVNVLATHGEALAAGQSTEKMEQILEAISQEVMRLTTLTKGNVTTLAEKVDADRVTVAQLEADARARGVGLELSRDELLTSLAEINQELAQPLTAASAIVELLEKRSLGDITEAQQEGLAVVSEGMDRLVKLISYLHSISGLPTDLSPDQDMLGDVYGK